MYTLFGIILFILLVVGCVLIARQQQASSLIGGICLMAVIWLLLMFAPTEKENQILMKYRNCQPNCELLVK